MLKKRPLTNMQTPAGRLRVVGYIRVSTDEQARDGSSLANQAKKIRQYCELHELDLVRIETDAGVSAKSLERDGLAAVLDDLKHERVAGLVITKLDRLTRSLEDWSQLIRRYFRDKGGAQLFSVSDHIDTRSANGRMVLNLIMTIAEWEREVIAERTKDVLQGKISRGERCGKIRFGYTLATDGKTLVPQPNEQEAIALMHRWNGEEKTYREMIELLEEMGIETKQPGSIWRPCTIRQILLRPTP